MRLFRLTVGRPGDYRPATSLALACAVGFVVTALVLAIVDLGGERGLDALT